MAKLAVWTLAGWVVAATACASDAGAAAHGGVHLGPRPLHLVDAMADGDLKTTLEQCAAGPFRPRAFSIGHRGAALQFPEHTRESYLAAARMGAGILECDVTFTKDHELVCRHSQCDLHTTTNILAVPELAAKCTTGFSPADAGGIKASARCCTSDLTLAEFKQLRGKMDAADETATTVEDYLGGTAAWRTELYADGGTLMTHAESIELFSELGVGFTPELKAPEVAMPFAGAYTAEAYAQQLIDDYRAAGVAPEEVLPQSFDLDVIRYWIANAPEFGRQAVYLDGRYRDSSFDPDDPDSWSPSMADLVADGLNIIAPPLWVLVTLDQSQNIVPSAYAEAARAAGLEIITWTLERSGPLAQGGGWYFQTINDAIAGDGDLYPVLDVLARQVGVRGVFSDWPATVTYYANCLDLE